VQYKWHKHSEIHTSDAAERKQVVKFWKILALLTAAILLTACVPLEFEEYPGEAGFNAATAVPDSNADRLGTEMENTLPVETQLILGTLLLEGTDEAVDAEQAAVLLPLWEKWHDLNRSNAATAEDRNALMEEIQAAMTPDQLEAINAMQLTQADVEAIMAEAAQSLPTPAGGNGSNPFSDGTQTLSPEELATLQSVYRGGFGGSRGPEWALLHALLDLLESKIQPS
jgi:hypothetical protein